MTFNIIHKQGLHMKKPLRYALFLAGMTSLPALARLSLFASQNPCFPLIFDAASAVSR
jgi:hypothetical protein